MASARSAAASSDGPGWGLVIVRVYIGWLLLAAGWAKVMSGVDPGLVTGTAERIAHSPNWYRWFGEDIVLANPKLFAGLIQWGELACGAALFLGALVRPTSLVVAFMMLNYWLVGPLREQRFVLLILVCALALFVSRAGRRMGVDGICASRIPTWLSWSGD